MHIPHTPAYPKHWSPPFIASSISGAGASLDKWPLGDKIISRHANQASRDSKQNKDWYYIHYNANISKIYIWMASCPSVLTHIKKQWKYMSLITLQQLDQYMSFRFRVRPFWSLILLPFCVNLYLLVLSCTSCCCAIFSQNRQNVG